MRIRSRAVQAVATIAITTVALAACDSGSGTGKDDSLSIVASTDVYGAIARSVAGSDASVTSLFSNPTGDPHEFEPSAQDTLKITKASIVVYNGGHYDAYLEEAAKDTSALKVDAVALQDKSGDHENEHVFYDLPTMKKVATAIADALSQKDAGHKADYDKRAQEFSTRLDTVIEKARAIGHDNPGAKVAATEPVAGYLLTLSGLTDAAPTGYTKAIEDGTDPAPADIAAANALVTEKRVRAVVLNAQTENAVTTALAKTASTAGVPVVRVTETLPVGVNDYISWQDDNVQHLGDALKTHP